MSIAVEKTMHVVILKSHNGVVHKVWVASEPFTKESIEEIESIADHFMQDIVYMEIDADSQDCTPESIMLDITKLNSSVKEKTNALD